MAIDKVLQRHFWAVILALVAIAAFLDAEGMMQLVGANLGPDDKQIAMAPVVPRAVVASGPSMSHATSADPILSRNPFDSTTLPLPLIGPPPIGESQQTATAPDSSDPYGAPDCDAVQVVIIAASTDPDGSFAALETTRDKGKPVLLRRGGDLGGRTVKFIGWDRVWLASGNQLCQSQLFKAPAAASASAAPPPPAPGAGGGVSDDIKGGIQKVGSHEFNVDRGVVDKILENQADLMKTAQLVPVQENGKVVGIRLSGVKSDSLLGELGMENGDQLEKINGFDMTSPEKALEAYARLRTADHLTVSVSRHGQDTNIDYNIK